MEVIMSEKRPKQVREPVQVYLDRQDRNLLDALAQSTGLPRAELLRRGIRRLAESELAEKRPGWSLEVLIGSIPDGPPDLSVRHDEYLAMDLEARKGGRSRAD
jgi:hypothetical protein